MKIYFAGSIRGGRDDKEIYSKIINLLQKYGEVLTKHVGDAKISQIGELDAADFLHKRDMQWLHDSDIVVAEVTAPSLGVGYELGIAETLNKGVLCLYRETPEKSLSAMVQGNKAFIVKKYKTVDDLPEIFEEFFQ